MEERFSIPPHILRAERRMNTLWRWKYESLIDHVPILECPRLTLCEEIAGLAFSNDGRELVIVMRSRSSSYLGMVTETFCLEIRKLVGHEFLYVLDYSMYGLWPLATVYHYGYNPTSPQFCIDDSKLLVFACHWPHTNVALFVTNRVSNQDKDSDLALVRCWTLNAGASFPVWISTDYLFSSQFVAPYDVSLWLEKYGGPNRAAVALEVDDDYDGADGNVHSPDGCSIWNRFWFRSFPGGNLEGLLAYHDPTREVTASRSYLSELDQEVIVVRCRHLIVFGGVRKNRRGSPIFTRLLTVSLDQPINHFALSPNRLWLYVSHTPCGNGRFLQTFKLRPIVKDVVYTTYFTAFPPTITMSLSETAFSMCTEVKCLIFDQDLGCFLSNLGQCFPGHHFRPGDSDVCVSHTQNFIRLWISRRRSRLLGDTVNHRSLTYGRSIYPIAIV